MLEARGFQPLVGTQCMYANSATGMLIVALALLGGLKKEYECTGEILGPDPGDVQCLKILGRTITLTSEGIEWEGDAKHVAAYLEKLKEFSSIADITDGWVLHGGNETLVDSRR